MAISRDFGDRVNSAFRLARFGGVTAALGQPKIGVQLMSAYAAVFATIGKRMAFSVQAELDRDLAAAGQAMTTDQAIELALSG